MGAARENAAAMDRVIFVLVLRILSLFQSLRSAYSLLKEWFQRASERTFSVPELVSFPQHVAIIGEFRSVEHTQRLTEESFSLGAKHVTIFDPTDTVPSHLCSKVDSARFISLENAEALSLVTAARKLAQISPHSRPVDVTSINSVVEWLDSDDCKVMLPSEPDLLLVFTGRSRVRCLRGFPVWQIRLSQIFFVDKSVEHFSKENLAAYGARAMQTPKRFGS